LTELKDFSANTQKKESEPQISADARRLKSDKQAIEAEAPKLKIKKALAFCALGNPENFLSNFAASVSIWLKL
jgi:tetraacyldisaccharide-1-P 4'-kinase